MKKLLLSSLVFVSFFILLTPQDAHAIDTLQVRPLLYKETLEKGQTKRGAVDVANGSNTETEYNLSVKLFRQTANNGALEFYDNSDITDGIVLDASNIILKAKEAARITFEADGSKLPSGDIFAVILVSAKHPVRPQAIQPAAQVGTLVIIQNGAPGPRKAVIDRLNIPSLQTGTAVSGEMTVSNPAPANTATGFFPKVTVKVTPFGASSTFDGPLVYAGRSRTFNFSIPSNQFGIYTVTVTANNVSKDTVVVLITGIWRAIFFAILIGVALVGCVLTYWRVRLRRRRSALKTQS